MIPQMSTVFLLEDVMNWEVKQGMTLYHVGQAEFEKFHDRPTWFSPFKEQAEGYKNNALREGAPCWLYTCKFRSGKIASEEDAVQFAKQVFNEDSVLYSMFDERVGEFKKEEIQEFIKLIKNAGYVGCQHIDFDSTDSQKDSKTLVLFHPNSLVDILDVQGFKP